MNSVFETIIEKIKEKTNTFFVFPSETAASLWARKICIHGELRSLSPEHFLAWDRFKEEAIRSEEKKRKPVSALIRRLFAHSLTQKNTNEPFLQALIPVQYAKNSLVFTDSIASLLSSLKRWEELHTAGHFKDDDEDRDLHIIKTSYAAFLQENCLYEPSWEKMSFFKNDKNYIIFFPEALEDFEEFKELLNLPEVNLYSCKQAAHNTEEKPILNFFNSARTEIRSAVLEIRRLHEAGLPYEEIAVTLSDYKNIAPYMERELTLHDIPFVSRSGKTLGEYPIGKLFSLISECSASLFSFDSVKRLLLDCSIPWKDPESNKSLIEYGIKNHCVAPFRDRSRIADAWEEGFKQSPNDHLAAYYKRLKKTIQAMTGAKSFRKILEQYYVFRSFLVFSTGEPSPDDSLDAENQSAESNAVLARCIEELSALIEAEETFRQLAVDVPFNFYVSHLRKKNYVYNSNEGGVNLYDYPVAAGTPFGCHILLNASQAAVVFQHRPLPFLQPDKRTRLGITDTDASAAMLSLYSIASYKNYNCFTRISASEKTFAGWAIPHSFFAHNQQKADLVTGTAAYIEDLFSIEQQWRAGSAEKPAQLYPVQKEGFKRWSTLLLESQPINSGGLYTGKIARTLREKIRSKNTGMESNGITELSVSASDLNEFFTCPLMWLYGRIFRLEKFELDASLLDAESLGLIYHKILERLFERIKDNHTCFLKEHLGVYFNWIEEITADVLQSHNTLRGPLIYPLRPSLASAINRKLRTLLKTEAQYFDGYKVKELEQGYKVNQRKLLLNGYIDRVSEGPSGPMIIDYKTGKIPLQSHCRLNEENELLDFQIPMYIKLYEEVTGEKVDSALFAGINKNEFVSVVGAFRKKEYSREQYQSTIDALDRAIEDFETAVSELNFTRVNTHIKTCTKCTYRTMCRSQYSLNPPDDRCSGESPEEEEDDDD
ncbi:MAG: PD-(D/E)XK nuclease family protein [Treponema sp.]|nr:PD-(D/E)XK nuclease family protein [Treponema sp.]